MTTTSTEMSSTRRDIKRQQLANSSGFKDELLKLETLGFTQLRRNIRLLAKLGDMPKVGI